MKKQQGIPTLACAMALPLLTAGCAGLDIEPTTATRIEKLHQPGSSEKGYPVFAPMLVVRGYTGARCKNGTSDLEKCSNEKDQMKVCMLSDPLKVPDYSKPFMISHRVGLGSADVQVDITDGWMLGSFKDASSNGELLKLLIAAGGGKTLSMNGQPAPEPKCPDGLFHWRTSAGKTELAEVTVIQGTGSVLPMGPAPVHVLAVHVTLAIKLSAAALNPLCKQKDCPKPGLGGSSIRPKTELVFRFDDREAAEMWIRSYGEPFQSLMIF